MTHRERLLTALEHQEPDRVPMDLGSTRDSSIVTGAYDRLKTHFGVEGPTTLLSRMMQVAAVDEAVLEALDIDARGVFPAGPPDEELGPDRYRDEWGVERVRPPGALYYDQKTSPLAGDITLHDLARYPWPDPTDAIRTAGLAEQVRRLRETTDCALVLNLPSAFVHVSQYLRGFEDWFVDVAADRRLLGALFDAVLEVNLAVCKAILDEVGDTVDVLMGSDDLGLQNGLMVPPEAYRDLIKPRHRKYFDLMHELSSAKVFFHTCGSVIDILDDLVEMGVEVLNPVQVSAAGMEPATLKRRWGARLAFWGAVDTQHLLPHGSEKDVRQAVAACVRAMGRGGGYVLGAVHNIQPDVPLENILALYDEGRSSR
jgi:uroporphyrinogen decarboxylase